MILALLGVLLLLSDAASQQTLHRGWSYWEFIASMDITLRQ